MARVGGSPPPSMSTRPARVSALGEVGVVAGEASKLNALDSNVSLSKEFSSCFAKVNSHTDSSTCILLVLVKNKLINLYSVCGDPRPLAWSVCESYFSPELSLHIF